MSRVLLACLLVATLAACVGRPRNGDDGMDGARIATGLRYTLDQPKGTEP